MPLATDSQLALQAVKREMLGVREQFEMVGVATAAVAAGVVDLHSCRKRTMGQHVGEVVGMIGSALVFSRPVPILVDGQVPVPALAGLVNALPEGGGSIPMAHTVMFCKKRTDTSIFSAEGAVYDKLLPSL